MRKGDGFVNVLLIRVKCYILGFCTQGALKWIRKKSRISYYQQMTVTCLTAYEGRLVYVKDMIFWSHDRIAEMTTRCRSESFLAASVTHHRLVVDGALVLPRVVTAGTSCERLDSKQNPAALRQHG